jgi:hypothetical protein
VSGTARGAGHGPADTTKIGGALRGSSDRGAPTGPDRPRHGVAGAGSVLFGLTTPEAVFPVKTGIGPAVVEDSTFLADEPGVRLAPHSGLRSLGVRREERGGVAAA